ncbi:MAG: helix-turn-helix domain-containing protein [Ferruginibacter sp.]
MYRTDVLVKIGRRIKMIRLEKNMTQNDLAIECEFEKASLSRIEAGKTNITIRTLYKICKALDIQIIELFAD